VAASAPDWGIVVVPYLVANVLALWRLRTASPTGDFADLYERARRTMASQAIAWVGVHILLVIPAITYLIIVDPVDDSLSPWMWLSCLIVAPSVLLVLTVAARWINLPVSAADAILLRLRRTLSLALLMAGVVTVFWVLIWFAHKATFLESLQYPRPPDDGHAFIPFHPSAPRGGGYLR
jgi:MFS family permease